MSLKGNKLKRKKFGNVFVNIWIICLCRGIRNVPHVSITGNHPTEGHATVLPAVRDVRIPGALLPLSSQVSRPSLGNVQPSGQRLRNHGKARL